MDTITRNPQADHDPAEHDLQTHDDIERIHDQTMELARRAGASEIGRSIKWQQTPLVDGEGYDVDVTSSPGYLAGIQVRKYGPSKPLQVRPSIQVTVGNGDKPGYAASVKTEAGMYSTAKNTEEQSTSVRRNGETITIKNPKAAELVARLALKKAGQVIEQLPEPQPKLRKRILDRRSKK